MAIGAILAAFASQALSGSGAEPGRGFQTPEFRRRPRHLDIQSAMANIARNSPSVPLRPEPTEEDEEKKPGIGSKITDAFLQGLVQQLFSSPQQSIQFQPPRFS